MLDSRNTFDHRQNGATDIYPDKFLACEAYTTSILSNVLAFSLSLSLSLSLVSLYVIKDREKGDVISCWVNNHYGDSLAAVVCSSFLAPSTPIFVVSIPQTPRRDDAAFYVVIG